VNTWVHLTAVYDAVTDQIRLYLDGQDPVTVTGVGGWSGSGGLLIGGGATWNSQSVSLWKGLVDEVRLYSGVLDPAQIAQDMNTRDGGS
jgi:hypothetical protein